MRDELENYVTLQRGLLESLRVQLKADDSLASLPKNGKFEFEGAEWTFSRHGAGALFRNAKTGVAVDVSDEVDNPALFDVWRLRTYFGSLGRRGVKSLERATGRTGQPLEKTLEHALSALLVTGDVERIGEHYRLCSGSPTFPE